jgi:spore coat-associated protein N
VSRLSALAAHPRRTVGALAVVLAAAGITVGSGANFTAHSASPSNVFTAGTLSIVNSKEGSALFTSANLKPGDAPTGIVDIQNTGSVPGTFTLSTSNVVDTGVLLGQLDLKVEDCGVFTGTTAPACAGATSVYNAKANAVGSVALGSFAPSAKHRYQFTVTMPTTIANTFQGKTASVEFDWDAAA